jgi:hypothetical protein
MFDVQRERDGILFRWFPACEVVERYMVLKTTVGGIFCQCHDTNICSNKQSEQKQRIQKTAEPGTREQCPGDLSRGRKVGFCHPPWAVISDSRLKSGGRSAWDVLERPEINCSEPQIISSSSLLQRILLLLEMRRATKITLTVEVEGKSL